MPVHIVCVNVTETISPVNQKYLLPEPFKKKKKFASFWSRTTFAPSGHLINITDKPMR